MELNDKIRAGLAEEEKFIGPSYPLSNQLRRAFWHITSFFLFQFSPRTLHGWRSFLLRLFGAKVGKGVRIYSKVKIWAPWNLVLCDECIVGNGVNLYSQGKIYVGKKAVVSQGTYVCAGTHDYTKADFPLITKPIYIGNNVWVAAEVFIHPGVVIGDGAVIGARSVVHKDMPEWTVCAGHPCKPFKKREFEEEKN